MGGAPGDTLVHACWVGPPERPVMTWRSTPSAGTSASGILILPPVGYEWWSTHRTLRVLAEALAADGHLVARLDYDGTGDSAGDQGDPGRVAAWRQSVAAAIADLRAQGCERVALVGVRLGGTLALLDGAQLGADAVALWAPVATGKRWARQLRMFAQAVPDGEECPAGALSAAGVLFAAETLAEVNALSAVTLEVAPADRVLIVDTAPDAKLVDHLTRLGVEVEARSVADGEQALEAGAEEAVVPTEVVSAIRGWFGAAAHAAPHVLAPGADRPSHGWSSRPAAPLRVRAAFPWRRDEVEESVVRVGHAQLTAVRCAPVGGATAAGTLVFLNSGSEPHIGPGRAWVEFARDLALRGHASYRVDWRAWGESPWGSAGPHAPVTPNVVGRTAPGRPYATDAVEQTVALVHDLQRDGYQDVVLCGLCASAWAALRAVLEVEVAGVVAMNPQLYLRPGDPFWNTMPEARRGRADEVAEIRAGAASGRWDAEDRAGERPWGAAWLDQLAAGATPVTMLFAEGDDGIEYLNVRIPLRLAAAKELGVRVIELDGVDHAMHRTWTRPRIADRMAGAVNRMCAAAAAG